MATSYDELWTEFVENFKTEDINIPTSQEKIYNTIHSAVRYFNNRLQESVKWDDTLEELTITLDDNQLLVLAQYIKLACLKNQLIFFTTAWQPFEREIGLKNYQTQVKSLEKQIADEEVLIEKTIQHSATDIL